MWALEYRDKCILNFHKSLQMTCLSREFEQETFQMTDVILHLLHLKMQPNFIHISEKHNIFFSPGAFSHHSTTCDFITLTIYFPSYYYCLSYWQVRVRGGDESHRRQEKGVKWRHGGFHAVRQSSPVAASLSIKMPLFLPAFCLYIFISFHFIPSLFSTSKTTRDFRWINIISTTTFSHYQNWPTF